MFSLQGVLTLCHLTLVVAAILYSQSLAGPDGMTRVDKVPSYQLHIRNVAIIVVSCPLGWLCMLPAHTGGPTHFDVLCSALGLGLNSILIGYIGARVFGESKPSQ